MICAGRKGWVEREALQLPLQKAVCLRVFLKGPARQGVSSSEVCPDTRAPDGGAKELQLGFLVSRGFPRPVVDKTLVVGIVNAARAREPSWT